MPAVDAATAKAKSLGAKIMMGPQEVMGHGHMTVITDPTGAPLALWQPIKA